MASSSIEWTDRTWNCVTGCDRVSAGCDHCYALTLAKRLKAMGNPRYQVDGNPKTSGPGFGVTLHPDKLADPLHWRDPQKVFVNSMSDLFHADVPDAFIAAVFAIMALCPQHTFQILTKRPQRMKRVVSDLVAGKYDGAVVAAIEEHFRDEGQRVRVRSRDDWMAWPLVNVWLGTSVENQEAAYRIEPLLKTPAAVRFLSCEPLIGPLDLRDVRMGPFTRSNPLTGRLTAMSGRHEGQGPRLSWVIAGGESGPGFRPLDLAWARDLRDQCVAAGVPYFFKQVGGIRPKASGRQLDGRTWDEFPKEMAS